MMLPDAVAKQAAIAAAQRLQIDDEAFAIASGRRGHRLSRRIEKKTEKLINATPYQWVDPVSITPRQWLYARSLIRKFVTVTVAPGGVGKSSLAIGEAMAMASGLPLLGKKVEQPLRVWLWNLEDPMDELQRRFQAAALRHHLTPADIEDRLFVDSGRDNPLRIAAQAKNGAVICRPVVDDLIAEMKSRGIDVLIVDPFVSSHGVSENENNAMDLVTKEWAKIADATNAAIHLVHHTRKLGSDAEVTAESSRGGKALTDAAREVRAVNRMSAEEGENYGVENHRSYFRVYSDKANMAPPADLSDWYRIENVVLANGDHVGVVTAWKPPGAFDDVSIDDLYEVQKRISAGDWREAIQAKEAWAGMVVADVLNLDPDEKRDRQKIKALLHAWIENGALRIEGEKDGSRRERRFVRRGEWVK